MPTESSIWDVLNEFLVPKFEPTKTWENLNLLGSDPNEWLRQGMEQMSSPKAQAFGALDPMLGMIMPNYRTPEAIQQLRKVMAREMRSRGPIGQIGPEEFTRIGKEGTYFTPERLDPIDQILRGSWYHGMSMPAREAVADTRGNLSNIRELLSTDQGKTKLMSYLSPEDKAAQAYIMSGKATPAWVAEYLSWGSIPKDLSFSPATLGTVFESGFPVSHHDALSLSNKLGEPSGVSLTMLPTKARAFSADEFIHRVLPQYGGPPTERTVNLMTPEGRKMLNDAYDVVLNQMFKPSQELTTSLKHTGMGGTFPDFDIFLPSLDTKLFNQGLSQQLQSQGKRGILYNPKRWDEYEMLMLDPKYVLPLDYRSVEEYGSKGRFRGPADIPQVTPGTRKGLSQIQDLMTQNASRLGDIYSERPWVQRINDVNKYKLLQMIDEQYREAVGKQLFGG